ncbi:hypothetical protein VCHE16_0728 [Vibrio paracholerae HE-16]|nr:hypothetical protein VCHE16_0728 [Vibrio paracholerae HE-16]EMP94110.1 hypothetical protein VC87395_000769 [Vibrio paracholerae 87395]
MYAEISLLNHKVGSVWSKRKGRMATFSEFDTRRYFIW